MTTKQIESIHESQILRLGSDTIQFIPHVLPGTGPLVFIIIDQADQHIVLNKSPDDARRFAERLKIAACQADSKARRKRVIG